VRFYPTLRTAGFQPASSFDRAKPLKILAFPPCRLEAGGPKKEIYPTD
jgi:hypothetical protein